MNAPTKINTSPTAVITGIGRASYVHVFQPKLNDLNGKEEYSLAFLIPKTDTETLTKLRAAAKAALSSKWPDPNKRPPNLKNPLRDGDTEKDDDAYKGHFFINAKSKNPPGIVDSKVQPITDARAFVSGDYCRLSLNAFAFDNKGNRGVAFGLNNIQVTSKGEPLSAAGRRAEQDFGAFDGGEGPTDAAAGDWDDDIPY